MKQLIRISLMLMLVVCLFACGHHKKQVEEMKQETDRLAAEMNALFVEMKAVAVQNAEMIAAAFEQTDLDTLSSDGMDVEQGGIYTWMDGVYYYPEKERLSGNGMVVFYNVRKRLSPDSKAFQAIQRKMALLDSLRQTFRRTSFVERYQGAGWFFSDEIVSLSTTIHEYPSIDFETFPGMMVFEWWQQATPDKNPQKTPFWTRDVFVSLTGDGWIETVSVPVYANGAFQGVVTQDISISDLRQTLIHEHPAMLLLLGPTASVAGMSQSAKTSLNVEELAAFDYLEQYQANPGIPEQHNLTFESHPADIRRLGQQVLSGQTQFELALSGKTCTVVVSKIPEVNFSIVGIVEK